MNILITGATRGIGFSIALEFIKRRHRIFGEVVSAADQDVVNKIAQDDVIKTIEITGDFDKFMTEENKKMAAQIDEILDSQFKDLRKY